MFSKSFGLRRHNASRQSPRRPRRTPQVQRLEDRLAPAAWNPIGPAPILNGQTPGNDPVTGRISALAADPTDANTIYIAAAGGGVWKTSDGGTTWAPLTDQQNSLAMGGLALAPGSDINHRILYAGTGDPNPGDYEQYGRGVLVSKDSGATWTLTGTSVFDRSAIGKVVIDPTDPTGNTAYAAVSGFPNNGLNHGFTGNYGIWKTTNGGLVWTNTTASIVSPAGLNLFSDLVMDPGHPNILYAAVGTPFGAAANGVYETTNGGGTWAKLPSFPGGATTGRISLAIADVGPSSTLYASVSDVGANLGATLEIVKSMDGGATWQPVMTKASANYINYMGDQGDYDQAIIIDPNDPTGNTVYASGQEIVIKTTDGGVNWPNISVGPDGHGPHSDHHALGFDAQGQLLDGNDGGIWRLHNNPLVALPFWIDINGNLQITQFYSIALDPTNPNIAWGGSQDNGTEKYIGSLAWNHVEGGDSFDVGVDPINPMRVYTEFNHGISLVRSDDEGGTFFLKTAGIQGTHNGTRFVIDPMNHDRLVLGTDYVNESLTAAESWTAIGIPGVNGFNPGDTGAVTAIATLGNTVYAAMTDGHVYVTTNDGSSWMQADPFPGFPAPPGGSPGGYQDIQIDSGDPTGQTAYIVTAEFSQDIDGTNSSLHHVFRTTNAGASWTDISGNLPNLPTWSVAVDHAHNTLYVGNDLGVYSSSNGGASWSRFGTGMPNVQVFSLQYNASLHVLAAGTYGRGMFEIPITAGSVMVGHPDNQGRVEGNSSLIPLGSFIDSNAPAGPYQVDVNWGDGSADTTFTTTSPGSLGSQPHTFHEEGTYSVKVTVTDSLGASGSATFKVVVSDPPVVGSGFEFLALAGVPFSNQLVASFQDPGGPELNETIASHYSATIDWGDNTPTTGGAIHFSSGVFSVYGNHTYTLPGLYFLHVTIAHEGAPPVTVLGLALVFFGFGGGFGAAPAGGSAISQPVSMDGGDILPAMGGTVAAGAAGTDLLVANGPVSLSFDTEWNGMLHELSVPESSASSQASASALDMIFGDANPATLLEFGASLEI